MKRGTVIWLLLATVLAVVVAVQTVVSAQLSPGMTR